MQDSVISFTNSVIFLFKVELKMKRCLLTCKVDDTGQSIGKRYSRTDEIGIPFAITVDYTTLENNTITLRELHTMKQLRVPMSDLEKVLTNLSN
jgi:glycyl-tRNA synthetase